MTTIPLAMLTALAAVVLLMIIGLVLWQKRSSSQLSILQDVAKTLEQIEETLKAQAQPDIPQEADQQQEAQEAAESQQPAEPEQAGEPEEQLEEESEEPKETEETDTEKALKAISQLMAQETNESSSHGLEEQPDSQMPAPAIDSMGKSGKSYTEEELELLIKE